jgi:hypothetical protein
LNENAVSGNGMTQFGRALSELNIEILCANTSQAKGRVERAHHTLQDRLVKELRLAGISTIEAANSRFDQCDRFCPHSESASEGARGAGWAYLGRRNSTFQTPLLGAREPFDRRKAALAKGQISTSPQLFKPGRKTTTAAMTHCTRPGSEQRVSSSNNRGICPLFWHMCCMKSAGLGRQGTQGPG